MRRAALPVVLTCLLTIAGPSPAQEQPPYLADRGPGIPTSLFGTYIRGGELLFYPFYEYTRNNEEEYKPSELGFEGELDYMGEGVEHELLLFFAYGFSDSLAVELEAAVWSKATLDKAPEDPSGVPARIEESGLGDVESQLRWRWSEETATRPEYFSFFEVVFPFQKDKLILGTPDWEFAGGFGAIKGFSWGTLLGKVGFKYENEEGKVEPGEYALEYLHWVSPHWRLVGTIEGEDDELSLIGEAQWHLSKRAFVKLNCGFGITEKAPDIAPEIGVLFSF